MTVYVVIEENPDGTILGVVGVYDSESAAKRIKESFSARRSNAEYESFRVLSKNDLSV